MKKIVYFDEEAAIDYINISFGGRKEQLTTGTSQTEGNVKVNGNASIGSRFSFLGMLKLNGETGISSELAKYSDKIVTSTISTTILTDYIGLIKEDEGVTKFSNINLYAIENSFTFVKMYLPYIKVFKDKYLENIIEEIDVRKFNEILDNVKGYYEFKAIYNSHEYIFRFNINSFRNNKITDLLKMDLVFYGVKVGETKEENLNIERELEIEENTLPPVNSVLEGSLESASEKLLDIYDIVLAGVEVGP